jgi:hypothetical protein
VGEIVEGKLEVKNDAASLTGVSVDGNTASVDVGGAGVAGDLVVRDAAAHVRVEIGGPPNILTPETPANYWGIRVKDGTGQARVEIGKPVVDGSVPAPVAVAVGGGGQPGIVYLRDGDGDVRTVIRNGSVAVGGNGFSGSILCVGAGMPSPESPMIGIGATILSGEGWLRLNGAGTNSRIYLDGPAANAFIGGKGADGDLMLYASGQDDNAENTTATLHLNANLGEIRMRNTELVDRIWMSATTSTISVRDDDGDERVLIRGKTGEIALSTTSGDECARLTSGGNLWLGGKGQDGDIMLFPSTQTDNTDASKASIHLDANAGDIILRNADCAEDFDVGEDLALDEILPGTLMAIDAEGRLRPSSEAYDRTLAGIVCGAGTLRPGIILGRTKGAHRLPIALAGRVYCRADANAAPIRTGDLLTSSATPGTAMRALDRDRSFGAVIGKALAPLLEGAGLIPVLVSLI